jgi:DNA protecting protein DprA
MTRLFRWCREIPGAIAVRRRADALQWPHGFGTLSQVPVMTTTHHHEYVPPMVTDVVTVASERVGVTNGLLLRFPEIHSVGDLALLDWPRIAIVGARKATVEGRRRAAQLARDCARAGIVVIAGLAEGIDHAAHTAAIEHGGRTIAVVGTPLDKVYPSKHAELQQQIYREHLLLSPFRWGDKFVPANFPERNRIMARLALATVIIEASDTSGSLHQAIESVQVGHPVFIAAAMLDDAHLSWPRRFVRDDQPLGRVLRKASDVIDFARGA